MTMTSSGIMEFWLFSRFNTAVIFIKRNCILNALCKIVKKILFVNFAVDIWSVFFLQKVVPSFPRIFHVKSNILVYFLCHIWALIQCDVSALFVNPLFFNTKNYLPDILTMYVSEWIQAKTDIFGKNTDCFS